MKLSKLLHDTGIKCKVTTDNNREDPEILGICCDSRQVRPGDLFLACPGTKEDGRKYIHEAIRRGAAAVLWEREDGRHLTLDDGAFLAGTLYGFPDREMILIGVTGTNGKTTTTWLIRHCLVKMGMECGLMGTVAYHWGSGQREAWRTTPQPDVIYGLLNQMKENGLEACAMEVSSHGLVLGRVKRLEFQYGIFTNLTEDHLDFHKTMEAYYQAKKQLFSQVKSMSFINIDDPWGKRLYDELQKEGRPVRGLSQKEGPPLHMALPGTYNQENGRLAGAVCEEIARSKGWEVTSKAIWTIIEEVGEIPGRFEKIPNDRGIQVYVDYAHTPDALERVLTTARSLMKPEGRLICVFGCGGDREREKRPLMGEIAGRLSQYTILTSDNPRSEDPHKIAAEIAEGISGKEKQFEILIDRKKAIEKALTLCKNQDIVIIAGKGHERTQTIGTTSYPFDDRRVAWEILQDMGKDLK